MIKCYLLPRFRIDSFEGVTLEQVATAATEGQVGLIVGSTSAWRHDVFDFKWKIEQGFWSSAVFAAVSSSLSHPAVVRVHSPRSARAAAALSPEA